MSIRLTVIGGCAVAFCLITGNMAQARTHDRRTGSLPLRQQEAGALFHEAGLRWISSGHCARRSNRHCTSFDGLRPSTLNGALDLREASHCGLVISGGTERGHAGGPISHHAGYKLDILPSRCLDRYIRHHYRHRRTRGDGARQWQAANGTMYAREPSHWDITFA